uniref:G-protein coupled receptors family 3 profile domain-containing protein n=2 Tax=Xenopus tropicalis TaxID=8364 RepID=A0A1B8YAQ0_XENTR
MFLMVILLHILPVVSQTDPLPGAGCALQAHSYSTNYKAGDLIIGAFIQLHEAYLRPIHLFNVHPERVSCATPFFRYYRHYLAFMFAIDEINKNPQILPNISLGYQIYDSCGAEVRAGSGTLGILSGTQRTVPNYNCWNNGKLLGFLGDFSTSTKYVIAQIISYGSTDPIFNDRTQFPSFYRTIPNEEAEMDGIVQILKHFGWKWVGLIISNDDTGYRARERISKGLSDIGGCLAFYILINDTFCLDDFYESTVVETIERTSANVIVLFISTKYTFAFFNLFSFNQMPRKVWITSSFFPNTFYFRKKKIETTFNGSLSVLIQEGEIPGFEEFFSTFSPNENPKNELTQTTWEGLFHCYFLDNPSLIRTVLGAKVIDCTGNETMSEADVSVYGNHNYRVTYRVYTAVYALARALHNLYSAQPPANHWDKLQSLKNKVKPWQLNASVRNVSFITNGDTHSLSQYGDPPARFDIIKWIFLPNKYMLKTKIGNFYASNGTHFYINSSDDLFGPHFKMIPQSLCNEPCAPGYRKAKIEGKPSCCYDCANCADGEMSNTTDALICLKCPAYQMPDRKRTACIPKATNYLSYIDTLGTSLTAIAFILFITASVVLGIFVKYWETPIVRANNQNLSCLLLISLMLCFLCTLLFIGRPTQICCLLRQVTFGIVFTISVSSVLAKTLTVIIAFNATKPGSKLKKYVGTQLAIVLVIVCSFGEMLISTVWMASNPPFLEADMFSEMDTIVLLCNEGSVTFFFCIIGYMGTLALLSFIAAFLAKDFPDRFNEAKNITFSMLGFCSVWGAFVPAYLSSKGSRMVAVEIFAILSSSAGLLGCIFAPKCYIIYLRPELNSRKTTIRK